MQRVAGQGGVRISEQIISPEELRHRVEAVRQEMAPFAPVPAETGSGTTARRAERLHRLWGTVSPVPLVHGPGPRGAAAGLVKRSVRRLTDWNSEPRWSAQHEIDAELARFASDTAAAIERLEAEVEHLHEWIARLQQELRRARLDESAG